MLRLGACLGVHVHIIHPTGFAFSSKALRRAGLDYLDAAEFTEHPSYADFARWRQSAGRRLVLLTTRAGTSAYTSTYRDGDILMVGRESAGVPDTVTIDQTATDGWAVLGEYDLAGTGDEHVELGDNTGTAMQKLVFDAVRITSLDGAPASPGDNGGCRAAGGTTGAGLVLAVLVALRRRRRRAVSAA